MNTPSVIHHTFVVERSYSAKPDRMFSAFANPEKKRRWFAAGEHHEVEQFEMDFRVGGTELVQSRFGSNSPFPGVAMINTSSYQDIAPNSRIVIASRMVIGDRPVSVSLATFEFRATEAGTDMVFTHQGVFFEGSGGPEMREEGWRKLLEKLAKEIAN